MNERMKEQKQKAEMYLSQQDYLRSFSMVGCNFFTFFLGSVYCSNLQPIL